MKRVNSILIVLILVSFLSCVTSDAELSGCEETACTLDFRTIVVNIENQAGNPVALDDFKVINLEDQMDITREVSEAEFEIMKQNGTYPLFGDEYSQAFQNKEIQIQFIGFLNGNEIVRSEYQVGANCCHVYYVSGAKTLIIE